MPPFEDLISWFFKLLIAGLMSFFWWGKKEDKKLLDSHAKDIVKLKTTAVTEDKVREIITDVHVKGITPVAECVNEIKRMVQDDRNTTKSVEIKMAQLEGYQKALKEMRNE